MLPLGTRPRRCQQDRHSASRGGSHQADGWAGYAFAAARPSACFPDPRSAESPLSAHRWRRRLRFTPPCRGPALPPAGSTINEVIANISKGSGIKGFFNGNLADVLRTAPQKSVQLASCARNSSPPLPRRLARLLRLPTPLGPASSSARAHHLFPPAQSISTRGF